MIEIQSRDRINYSIARLSKDSFSDIGFRDIILLMHARVVKRLLELDHEFYSRFAPHFSGTRRADQINVKPLMPYMFSGMRFLDVGCGNGRLAARLSHEPITLEYVGVDNSRELITFAKTQKIGYRVTAEFQVSDITMPSWGNSLPSKDLFDLVSMFAVLHHIPSHDLRRDVLKSIRKVIKPGSPLIMSNWQFNRNQRLQKKIVDWSAIGIDRNDLEEGDALLDWRNGGIGYRYCHLLTEKEIGELAVSSQFRVLEQFYSANHLDLISILQAD